VATFGGFFFSATNSYHRVWFLLAFFQHDSQTSKEQSLSTVSNYVIKQSPLCSASKK